MTDPIPPSPSPSPPELRNTDWAKVGAIAGIVAVVVALLVWALPPPFKWGQADPPPVAPPPDPGGETTSPPEEEGGSTASPIDEEPGPEAPLTNGGAGTAEDVPPEDPKPPKPEGEPSPESETSGENTPEPDTEVQEPPITTTPGEGTNGSGDGQGDPRDIDYQEGVVARYVDPSGPRMLGGIPVPRLPTDALLSLAAGKELRVLFWVSAEGRGTVTEVDAPWLPEALRRRIGEDLERRRWKPSNDGSGTPRASEAEVIFSWKRKK